MKRLRVGIKDNEYDILIERGLLSNAGELVKEVFYGNKLAVVTDSNVGPLYVGILKTSLVSAGFDVSITTIPAGENSKSISMLEYLYDEFMRFGLSRADAVVALGGGVVGDLAGFAAATILRGVQFIQIPTTLLSQVDSSVGGKVAVNLKSGKNLAGAFYQPRLVLVDPDCLETLTGRVFSDGMAEVIKYGAIVDKQLFEKLMSYKDKKMLMNEIDGIIMDCCDIKRRIVEQDEKDTGLRMILNFGHTLGHAYEKSFNYEKYTHGEAVAAGMCKICEIGEKIGKTKAGTAKLIRKAASKYQLPHEIPVDKSHYAASLSLDKKSDGGYINLILIKEIGSAFTYKTLKSSLLDLLDE